MVTRQVLIVHGWSDTSASFQRLAFFLEQNGFATVPLWLADYISLDDDVEIQDAAKRMHEVILAKMNGGEIQAPFDMIVHSTGGLVSREWIVSYYGNDIGQCPLKRLVMLAPANFGSPLASKGQSLLGRVIKGWNPHGSDSSYRCLYADWNDLMGGFYPRIGKAAARELHMSISAAPPGDNIQYFGSVEEGAKGSIVVHRESDGDKHFFRCNQTHFVKLIIPRNPKENVFRLTRA